MKKKLLSLLCVLVLVVGAVVGTYAYLTDEETAVNTFTVGNVDIQLDEAVVDVYGEKQGNDRTEQGEGNAYKLIPGHYYTKDPKVTVLAGSEKSYVRMLVTFNYSSQLDAIFDPTPETNPSKANLTEIFEGYDGAKWKLVDVVENTTANTRTYEFRYYDTVATLDNVDKPLEALFTGFTLPENITKEQLATLVTLDAEGKVESQFSITVVAQAIQAMDFDDDDDAWANF